ncbi:MAG: N-acetyl-gamma-glutamyl-phosphate reductase [Alphaproteobacteria bacterium]
MVEKVKIAILGASGYTGSELLRLLHAHPYAQIVALGAGRQAGQKLEHVFPQFSVAGSFPALQTMEEINFEQVDVIFCALPHGMMHKTARELPSNKVIIDLSADFRLRDLDVYQQWYGHPHESPDLQPNAVYGLTEHYRSPIKTAQFIANPGCYPTCAALALLPLIKQQIITVEDIIIDAKSGVSGAGRDAKTGSLYTEVSEGIHAYGVASHRHTPEIEQTLEDFSDHPNIHITFTPHLMPMSRGMLTSIYLKLAQGKSVEDAHAALATAYEDEYFVNILPMGQVPATRHVRGSNFCNIGVVADRQPNRFMLFSVIDNLVKGASGQAIQNMNIRFGFAEETGLTQLPLFP